LLGLGGNHADLAAGRSVSPHRLTLLFRIFPRIRFILHHQSFLTRVSTAFFPFVPAFHFQPLSCVVHAAGFSESLESSLIPDRNKRPSSPPSTTQCHFPMACVLIGSGVPGAQGTPPFLSFPCVPNLPGFAPYTQSVRPSPILLPPSDSPPRQRFFSLLSFFSSFEKE